MTPRVSRLLLAVSLLGTGVLIGTNTEIGVASRLGRSSSETGIVYGPRTEFVPISSYRTFDSRADGQSTGNDGMKLPEAENPLSIFVGNNREQTSDPFFGAPGRVVAVSFNVQVVETEGFGFLHIDGLFFADGSASTLNWSGPGQDEANSGVAMVIDPESLDVEDNRGELGIYIGGPGKAHVIVDITGYFVEVPAE